MNNDKLVLIDGHALAYRMFYALPLEAFTTKSGEPTNATYGFTRSLMDLLLNDHPPKYLAVAFDKGLTFRDEIFEEYKGTREKMPDELDVQIQRIRQVVETFNIPVLELEGYEADDVLGTVARQAKNEAVHVYIVTGDRDLLQLVDDNTTVELPPGRYQREPSIYDVSRVRDKYSLEPRQIVDLKALMGDSSDNIPGVYGVGEKTATRLLQKYETLDGIYEHLDEVKTRWRNKLEEGRESAYLSRELAQIHEDVPITLELDACVAQEFDPKDVLELFQELEFRSLTGRLADSLEKVPQLLDREETQVTVVRDEAQLEALREKLEAAEMISFDVETTSLDKMTAELVGICLCVEPPEAFYVPVGHLAGESQAQSGQMSLFAGDVALAEGQLSLETVLDALRPALTDPDIPKVAHNAKYDYMVLARHGLEVDPIGFDTMIAEWLTDPSSKFMALKGLAGHRLGAQMTDITDLIGSGRNQKTMAELPIEEVAPYGAADADMTMRLLKPLREEIEAKGLDRILEIEMPFIAVLSSMEQEGVAIDRDFFAKMSQELDERLQDLEARIFEIAGHPFNVNSTQQLSEVLFDELKLPHRGLRKTKSGYYSTAADVLESLREADETSIIDLILEYRELGKLKSTYVDALPELVNEETGRIHSSFNQTGTVTGRIASSSPNLQNIPVRTEVGQQIRRGFVARPGWCFLAADYSQVELRILAHITQDEAMLEAFRQGQDIHRATAAAVYGVPLEEVTFQQRQFAKNVNFGLIYGMGPYRLARESGLTLAEAENYIKEYFERFPGIEDYLERTKRRAREKGYVETLLGRRRYFPIFQARSRANRQMVARSEREAINHPIQGTAADIIKIAMIRLYRKLREGGYRARMILQIHDELLLEVPEAELDAVRELVVTTMSDAFELDVPLKVEVSSGYNWLELKE
ncbi:MAG TPA: DNA polymerase I [Candidatus Sulfomarinibacteraceae bacterium]|nr:DNA polymerase I [Candidatus Sulfomarinibacteraceae bacterium]